MRLAAILALLSSPAAAWEFAPGLPCVLTHAATDVAVELTYDPTAPLYTISLTRAQGFDAAPVFSMQFQGPNPIGISTDRHVLTEDGKTVTVTDSGFGNVLNGMQFNFGVTATLGDQVIHLPLIGAADPVAAFRACEGTTPSV